MKQLFLGVLGLLFFTGTAQTVDTIYVNENQNTALFFPEKVRQGIVGSENFVFSYSQEKPQYFGLLKGVRGSTSNLLVLTQDGQIYSYVLSYRAHLPYFNYFIGIEESIGNEKPLKEKVFAALVEDTMDVTQRGKDPKTEKNALKMRAEYHLKNSKGEIKSRKKKGLKLAVGDMNYFKDEVYLVVALENQSGITFEPDYLNVYISRGNRKRNASYQKLLLEPIYIHQFPPNIYHHQEKKFVLVFPKFTLGENEELELEVREKKGSRWLRMKFKG
ncbi:protein of unknown function [Salinimicrobium catena]|uniref:DUF4138 domain-containing protein n=1 Tax=Salinimicrobium catena TaxID=390640 RepID=A0A1H5MT26_9FLAO|nr:DUF4138 domain-containing protein [Salinimicrobium catena]SDL29020.1 protein of unknown function [Salinimicrobium catena]SEE92413.1 protein of unknown function [Salinimicrobium catena]